MTTNETTFEAQLAAWRAWQSTRLEIYRIKRNKLKITQTQGRVAYQKAEDEAWANHWRCCQACSAAGLIPQHHGDLFGEPTR